MKRTTMISALFLILTSFTLPANRNEPGGDFCDHLKTIISCIQNNNFETLCGAPGEYDDYKDSYMSKILLSKKGLAKVLVYHGTKNVSGYNEAVAYDVSEKKAKKVYQKYFDMIGTCLGKSLTVNEYGVASNEDGSVQLFIWEGVEEQYNYTADLGDGTMPGKFVVQITIGDGY